ncbi:MAG: aminoacyl-tRNA deacylase [Gammaproteobacteria bacterium]|nr:MAG: aminoacyl-tRNA deacylase [Gammaproteobacteria bacterium]
MNIAPTLVKQLVKHRISYDTISHGYSHSSLHAAHSANIPAQKMVKTVILEDDRGYVMALVPANHYVKINELNMLLNRHMGLATETELAHLFTDCEPGAIPPVGAAYGMTTVVDKNLDDCNDVYIEAGNHTDLLHISGSAFRQLVEHSRHASICVH